jgi:DNA ligase-1
LVRTLIQNLRIGAVRLTLTTALARAFALNHHGTYYVTPEERQHLSIGLMASKGKKGKGKESDEVEVLVKGKIAGAEALVRRVYVRHPNYSRIVPALLETGLDLLDVKVPLAIGTPLQPMLGAITRSIDEVYTRLSDRPFVAEAKLDGQRGQIHVSTIAPEGNETGGVWYEEGKLWYRIFSRNIEDMTDKYPDIIPTLAVSPFLISLVTPLICSSSPALLLPFRFPDDVDLILYLDSHRS